MILPWKRKEVYMGFDMQMFNSVLNALSTAHIRYSYQTVNHGVFRGRATSGNTNYSLMYYVYVHHDDYDQACHVIRQAK